MLIALTHWLEGDIVSARKRITETLRSQNDAPSALPRELLIYSLHHNGAELAGLDGDPETSQQLWRELASVAQQNSDTLLFQLAVARLTGNQPSSSGETVDWRIAGVEPGMRLRGEPGAAFASRTEVWVDGARLRVYRNTAGARMALDDRGIVRHAWRTSPSTGPLVANDSYDRALTGLGTPNRRIHMTSGTYLAYDDRGVGVHLIGDRIDGWFLYPRR